MFIYPVYITIVAYSLIMATQVHLGPERGITMAKPQTVIMNLAQLREAIKSDASLPEQARSEMASAISRFCEIAGVEPAIVVADPTAIRTLREKASWQVAGLKKVTWRNMISRITRAL